MGNGSALQGGNSEGSNQQMKSFCAFFLKTVVVLVSLMGLAWPVFWSEPVEVASAPSPEPVVAAEEAPPPQEEEAQAVETQQPVEEKNQALRKAPVAVRGIYITSWTAGSSRFPELVRFVKNNNLNAMVIDLKDDTGVCSFQTEVDFARKIGAQSRRIAELPKLLADLKKEGIYTIARIVAFKDSHLARKRPDLAFQAKSGGIWRDRKGESWVSPYSQEVWQYLTELGKEAIRIGFDEVQYDYVRFPSDGKLSNLVYPEGRPVTKQISAFLCYATEEIHSVNPAAIVSADTFGLAGSAQDDLGIGQYLEELDGTVDYLSHMAYPSHYAPGTYGLANPNANPYQTIKESIGDHQKRLTKSRLRPWLQAFTLGPPAYGVGELQDQIKALRELDVDEFLLWNPGSRYGVFAGGIR